MDDFDDDGSEEGEGEDDESDEEDSASDAESEEDSVAESSDDESESKSAVFMSSSRGGKLTEERALCLDILKVMVREDKLEWFHKPVDKRDVPDYYEIIKKPMDFKTIRDGLDSVSYHDAAAFAADVRLIFANCNQVCSTSLDLVMVEC